jgi:hypothetical protein
MSSATRSPVGDAAKTAGIRNLVQRGELIPRASGLY